MRVAFKTTNMDDVDLKDEMEKTDQDSHGDIDARNEASKSPCVPEDPKKLHLAGALNPDEEDKSPGKSDSSEPAGLSKSQRKRMRQKKKKEEAQLTGDTAEDGICDYTRRKMANKALLLKQSCTNDVNNIQLAVEVVSDAPKHTNHQLKNPNSCSTISPIVRVIEDFRKLCSFLRASLATLDTTAITAALKRHLVFCSRWKIRPSHFIMNFFQIIDQLALAHKRLIAERSLEEFFCCFYALMEMFLNVRHPRSLKPIEADYYEELHAVITDMISKILADVHNEFDGTRLRRLHMNWLKGRNARVCASDGERRNGIVCLDNFIKSVLKVLVFSDEPHPEMRFVYDGTYWSDHRNYQDFRDLYLSCNVLIAVRGRSFRQDSRQHLVVVDFTMDSQYLQYYGRVLEFWQDFERFQKGDFESQGANDSTVSSTIPRSSKYPQDDDSNYESSAFLDQSHLGPNISDGSPYEGASNALLDDNHLKQNYVHTTTDEESVSLKCDLSLTAEADFFQYPQRGVEDSEEKPAIDYPLECLQEHSNARNVLMSVIFSLAFKEVMWFFIFYCVDVVFWMSVFMYFCIYFVIKF